MLKIVRATSRIDIQQTRKKIQLNSRENEGNVSQQKKKEMKMIEVDISSGTSSKSSSVLKKRRKTNPLNKL